MDPSTFLKQIWASIVFLLLATLIFGFAYPGFITLILQNAFPDKANGSLVYQGTQMLGSHLIGQAFSDPKYFWSRPSASIPFPYNPRSSTGSNLSPANPALVKNVKARINALILTYPNNHPIPIDLVTGSASGLDPHISIAAAIYQVPRIANARMLAENLIYEAIKVTTESRQFGILGEPRVNVVKLNLLLDTITPSN